MDIHASNEVYVQAAAHWRDVAEKSQIQALNPFQAVRPTMPGTPERHSHDYVRPGTTSVLADLDKASDMVIGSLRQRHRAHEFEEFLAEIDSPSITGTRVQMTHQRTSFSRVSKAAAMSACPVSLVWSVAFVGSQLCVQLQMLATSCGKVRPLNDPVRAMSQS